MLMCLPKEAVSQCWQVYHLGVVCISHRASEHRTGRFGPGALIALVHVPRVGAIGER